jgi:arylsulfatase A-like enzyme
VILISIDSLRADMPWAGYARDIAPRLTAWSKTATVYNRAYSLSSSTSKSVPGMLSGRYPSELTRTGVFFTRYAAENRFFCEQLGEASIPCVAGHAHAYLGKGVAGFDQGFSVWKLVPGITFDPQTDPHITSQKLTPLAIEMLSDPKLTSKTFFAWFHFMDPHDQYKPHAEGPRFGGKPRDIYDQEVHFADEWVGKLLDFIEQQPWAPNTAIMLTADHGEAFGEHGLTRHAFELYDVLVHVPWMIKVPGTEPRAIDVARSHIDLAPTILELLGQPVDKALPGRSLKRELLGAVPEARDVICDLPQDDFNKRRRALIHENWKLIAFEKDERFELYRLDNDPGETKNLAKREGAALSAMVARYNEESSKLTAGKVLGGIRTKD